jgi:2-keto-4-pentenoate hydratase/2-oxohepta-3-ene-1,7-dioic acid hydratase in catechol pathway
VKLASFAVDTPVGRATRVGVKSGDALVDATTAYAAHLATEGDPTPVEVATTVCPPSMRDFLRRGDRAFAAAETALEHAETVESADGDPARGPEGGRLRFPEAAVDLLAPVPRPNSLRDFMAFEEHVRNTLGEPPDVWFELPVGYKSNPDSVVGPGATVEWPDYSDQMDYELEVAAVVGTRGTEIPADEADEYVAGYTVFNDFSARDIQMEEMRGKLGPAKGKDFANGLGPYLVTPDEVDVASAEMRAEVNGETWSEGTAGEMHHSFADIVAHVSQSETIHPGDVLGSGTVGTGCGLELGRFLESGDTVRLTIEGIGTLENEVV